MDAQDAVHLMQQAVLTALVVGAPVLLVGVLMGLVIGLFQALTQVQDQTVAFVPKILAMLAAMLVCLPWALQKLIDYSEQLWRNLPASLMGGG
jgi:flagellar biosynthetic protein FliQ